MLIASKYFILVSNSASSSHFQQPVLIYTLHERTIIDITTVAKITGLSKIE
jgi:hypothetical protein